MSMNPYQSLPQHAFWKKALAQIPYHEVDPLLGSNIAFKLNNTSKIATAGSCFAQHISRQLTKRQCNYLITEPPPPRLPTSVAQEFNYGIFSARYGNIYSAKHLLQLFDRAHGDFEPIESCWVEGPHRFIDPFRPNIQPDGFYTKLEFNLDRKQHLRAVKNLFENVDVFIFTLGLTEYWQHKDDGAVFPLCPGVAGGLFDSNKHLFKNSTVSETIDNLEQFFKKLKRVNPGVKMILTLSPVPLIATASGNHVLLASSYSKSVLRVAAEEVAQKNKDITYFPAYEIITGHFNRGQYFSEDLRTVTREGINHVMRLFFKYFFQIEVDHTITAAKSPELDKIIYSVMEQQCDEELLEHKSTTIEQSLLREKILID